MRAAHCAAGRAQFFLIDHPESVNRPERETAS
jgi:hypothetical protein